MSSHYSSLAQTVFHLLLFKQSSSIFKNLWKGIRLWTFDCSLLKYLARAYAFFLNSWLCCWLREAGRQGAANEGRRHPLNTEEMKVGRRLCTRPRVNETATKPRWRSRAATSIDDDCYFGLLHFVLIRRQSGPSGAGSRTPCLHPWPLSSD